MQASFAASVARSTPARRTAVRMGALVAATTAALTIGTVAAPAADALQEDGIRSAVQAPGPIAHAAPAALVTHTVRPGDTLTRIARLFGLARPSDWRRLYDANLQVAHPDVLHIGEVITIPSEDAALAPRPLPVAPVPDPVVFVSSEDESDQADDDSDENEAAPARSSSDEADEADEAEQVEQVASAPSGSVWDELASCESGGDWGIDTGNGYYGGLQFSQSSWEAVGGSGSPADASRDEQIARAEDLQAAQGWDAWPTCSSQIGLR